MDPGIVVINAISSLAAVLIVGVIAWTIVAVARARRARVAEPIQLPAASLRPLEERLERMELAAEAIALQVERIAEGQRFVTGLLSKPGAIQGHLAAPAQRTVEKDARDARSW